MHAQPDSLVLESITISTPKFSQFAAGSKILHLESTDSLQNLNDQLNELPSIAFKNYGNYQLSSIALRGTSAAHTLLLWNGIPVNSPTLGQGDFSLFPSFLMDDVSVHYGNGSAMVGSGAIGGTVSMDYSAPIFQNHFKPGLSLSMGSFGHYFLGAKTKYGSAKWAGSTKIYRRSIENDFTYPLKGTNEIKTQDNASVLNYGAEQQLHYKINAKQRLSLIGMYTFNDREIQPAVTNYGGSDKLNDENARLIIDYLWDAKAAIINVKSGYVLNDQYYNDTSRVKSEQWFGSISLDKSIAQRTNIRAGITYNYFIPKVDKYYSQANEDRSDAYLSIKYQLMPLWLISLNLRQSLFDGELTPFTPSLGQEWEVKNTDISQFTLRNTIGRAYRIPTLNDRFWYQGGNPDIRPEKSYAVETGANWKLKFDQYTVEFDGTYYHQQVTDWIIWLPTSGFYTAMNIREVKVDGVEFSMSAKKEFSKGSVGFTSNYSFTKSINKKGLNNADVSSVDKQLPYVPLHMTNGAIRIQYRKWQIKLQGQYTGKRYITTNNDEFQALDAFTIFGGSISSQMRISKVKLTISAQVNNVLNTYYEQLKNHAMPGRNYLINISINL